MYNASTRYTKKQTLNQPTKTQQYLRLLQYLKQVKGLVAIAVATMLMAAATEPLLPALMEPLIDRSLIDKDRTSITWIPLAMLALFLVRGIIDYLNRISTVAIAQQSIEQLRNQMFAKLQYLPMHSFEENTSGSLISRFTFDVNQMANALSEAWVVLIRDSLVVLALVSYLLYLSWQLSLVLLLVGPIAGYIIHRASNAMRKYSANAQTKMGDMTHLLEESIEGHRDIKIFAAEHTEKKRFNSVSAEVRDQLLKINRIAALNVPLVQVIAASSVSVVLYIAFEMNAHSLLSPGVFVSYITAMALLFEPIRRLTHVNPEIQKGLAAADTLFAILDAPVEIDNGNQVATNIKGEVQFNDVFFNYPNGTKALKAITFNIKAGEKVAIVGTSGSGKSTIMNLLMRFYHPQNGEICIDGIPINALTLESLRQNIALVSQKVVLFDASAGNNIAFGSNSCASKASIKEAAINADADAFIQTLENGYDARIGENGSLLSGGQRQRIAIARAFLKNAPILLLDEASSALDNESESAVQKSIEKLRQGRTTLIIAHRLSTIKNADRIIVMQNGKIIDQGNHETLLHSSKAYSNLYKGMER